MAPPTSWVWLFDSKIIPGSCDKLRLYWAGPYKIIGKLAPALAEVIDVYERGKPRIMSIAILKEFRSDNNIHGFPSDPPPHHPLVTGGDEIEEVPNIPNKPLSSDLEAPAAVTSDLERPAAVTMCKNVIQSSYPGKPVNPYEDQEQRVDHEIIRDNT